MPDDWIDEAYRNAFRQEYNLSVNGGGTNGTFFASLGYLDAEGIAVGSDYERYTARMKATYQATRWLNIGGNVSFARSTTNNGADVSDTEDSGANNIYSQIMMMGPIYPVYLRDGEGNILRNENGIVGDFGDGQLLGSDYVRPYLTQVNGISEATMRTPSPPRLTSTHALLPLTSSRIGANTTPSASMTLLTLPSSEPSMTTAPSHSTTGPSIINIRMYMKARQGS